MEDGIKQDAHNDAKPTIGFVGIGIMGKPIARHLIEAGYPLVAYSRCREKAQDLVEAGAQWVECISDVARASQVIFTMVGYPEDVEEVYFGEEGLLASAPQGAYLIDLTTTDPVLAKEIAAEADALGKHAFDCPVTGGEAGAQAGNLTLIVGATQEMIAPVLPILRVFSEQIYYFGFAGGGQTAKLCNQVSLASCMVGYAEALTIAEQAGIDPHEVLRVINHGTGSSGAARVLAPQSLAGNFDPGFLVEHMRKDIGLALSTAEELSVNLPGTTNAFQMFDLLCAIGGERLGTQALTLVYDKPERAHEAGLDWDLLNQDEDEDESEGESESRD